MPTYRGNDGNLLQHWVLCELLQALAKNSPELAFIDAYSMSPCATEMHEPGDHARFNSVRRRLPGQRSAYELTWNKLASECSGYPNSAAFVKALWPHRFSFLLCEKDRQTVQELETWSNGIRPLPEVYERDWRDRFKRGIHAAGNIVFFSFDPNRFDQNPNVKHQKPEDMYPCDLDLLASVVREIRQPVIVQLSTYSANNDNSQEKVFHSVSSGLKTCGLEIVARVNVDGQMMSLILARNIDRPDCFRSLATRFQSWLRNI